MPGESSRDRLRDRASVRWRVLVLAGVVAVLTLTLKSEWLEPAFWPETLDEAPFVEFEAIPRFADVRRSKAPRASFDGTLDEFARQLLDAVRGQLAGLSSPVHCLLSGGYDSRALAWILEREMGVEPIFVTDGEEEPTTTRVLDYLGVPTSRRYVHDLDVDDPYGLVDATVTGWAPIYHQMSFSKPDPKATLVTGLGGGEWYSYPAAGWHRPRRHRTSHATFALAWIDTWPQYWLLPDAWARGYANAIHPYTTLDYARVANKAKSKWVEIVGRGDLDAIRKAMLDSLDPKLATLGWEPHLYNWRLSNEQRDEIDDRFRESWLASETSVGDSLRPSLMHHDEYACLMGGFAQWCDALIEEGHDLQLA